MRVADRPEQRRFARVRKPHEPDIRYQLQCHLEGTFFTALALRAPPGRLVGR